jgi:hypothetical protein
MTKFPILIAVISGSIAKGFALTQITEDAPAAQKAVTDLLAQGKLAECVEIQKPSAVSENKRQKDFAQGEDYVLFSSGYRCGVTLVGPFPDYETAEEFGEANRSYVEEYELWTYEAPSQGQAEKQSRTDLPQVGDVFVSNEALTDTDENGQERSTNAGETWTVTDINPNGEGPNQPNFGLSCEATGALIYAGVDELASSFSPAQPQTNIPRQRG